MAAGNTKTNPTFSSRMLVIDADACIVQAGMEFCQLLGYEPTQLQGMPVSLIDISGELDGLAQHMPVPGSEIPLQSCYRSSNGQSVALSLELVSLALGDQTCLIGQLRHVSQPSGSSFPAPDHLPASPQRNQPVGILHYDLDLQVMDVNARFAEIIHAPLEYMRSLDCKQLRDQSVIPAMRQALTGRQSRYEGPYVTSYGDRPLWVSIRCEPVRDVNGEISGGMVILEDLTRQRQVEAELQAFRFISENAHDAYMLTDEKARVRFANNAAAEQLGYSKQELLQMTVTDFDPLFRPEQVRVVFEKGKTSEQPPFESFHQRKDGSVFPVEITARTLQIDGEWLCFTADRDISERKKTELELQKFRFFSDHASDGILLVNQAGQILYANRLSCKRLGYPETELLQLSLADIDPDFCPEGLHDLFLHCKQQAPAPFEGLQRRRDGSVFPVEVSVTVLEFDGQWLMFRSIRDITERKQVEAREQRQREGLTALNEIAALSHLDLDEQLSQALQIVCRQLELPLGIISRINGDNYDIQAHHSPPDILCVGQRFQLGKTYCDITLAQQDVVAISEMQQSVFHDHPCYREFALEAYIGAPVTVDGKVYGTVNFSSAESYPRNFDRGDREFVSLLARWVGSAIEREQRRLELAASEARLQTIIDNEPECVKVVAADGRLLQINAAGLDMLQVDSLCEAERLGLMSFVEPKYRNSLSLLFKRAMAGTAGTLEFVINARKGARRWLDTHAAPLRDRDGRVSAVVAVTRDITENKRAQSQLRLSASVFSHAHEGIMICDDQKMIIDVNPTFTEITGYRRQDVIGRCPTFLSSGVHDREFYQSMWQAIEQQGHWEGEIWNRHKDGNRLAERLTITAVYDKAGGLTHYIGTFTDITLLKEQQERLEHLAHYDPLTLLPNRTLLSDRMVQALAQARRNGDVVAVCYLDLDGFKEVNDSLGHKAGDELLQQVALRLKRSVREVDTVARLGGDEFILLLVGNRTAEQCFQVVERVLQAIAEPVNLQQACRVSGSIGVSLFPSQSEDPDSLIRQADQAMYLAKQMGKNCYRLYSEAVCGPGLPYTTIVD